MIIEENKVVTMDYTLMDESGEVLDTSDGETPLAFIFGTGFMVPGLETELKGKKSGDNLTVVVSPENGYGVFDPALIIEVPVGNFDDPDKLEEGLEVHTQTKDGYVQMYTVTNIEKETVTLDGNHPLADKTLTFDVTIREVRDATKEELDHGHAHGPGGHHHH